MWGGAPGIRFATAATAPATAPLTVVVADARREGSAGFVSARVDRAAADLAAFLRRAVLVDVARDADFVATVRLPEARVVAFLRRAAARDLGFRVFDCFLVARFAKSPPLATPVWGRTPRT
jgi:hypothetical protein